MTAVATAEEAAAIAAAIERFSHETAPAAGGRSGDDEVRDPWIRVAMLEGVTRQEHVDVPHLWINT